MIYLVRNLNARKYSAIWWLHFVAKDAGTSYSSLLPTLIFTLYYQIISESLHMVSRLYFIVTSLYVRREGEHGCLQIKFKLC